MHLATFGHCILFCSGCLFSVLGIPLSVWALLSLLRSSSLLVSVAFVSSYVNAASSSSAYFVPSLRTDLSSLAAFLFSNLLTSLIHGS